MLPIDNFLPEIHSKLSSANNLVLAAEPGAGKSTAVPLSLLNADFLHGKKIIMLEPRRVAVKSIAHYLASLLGEKVGQRIGYQIRNEGKSSAATQLEIVTEGILTRRLQQDPELNDVGLIIFDEFHERSIHADLALMLALEVQEAYREDLKLLVMSATIDTEQISNYLQQADILTCPGRTYPVTVEYLAGQLANQPVKAISVKVMQALAQVLANSSEGDILVFLPGQADIKRCLEAAQAKYQSEFELLPLYGSLPLAQQEKVLNKANYQQRRVIFATNIAETSLTIAGISYVIDSGLEKTLTFDIKSGLSRLATTKISKASATQRAGRAGRLQNGHCLRLWRESEHQALNDFQKEEIKTANLANLTLDLSAWGITTFDEVNWLTAPPKNHFEVACQLNQSLGLLDKNNQMTQRGHQALKLGLEPRLASMLLSCETTIEKQLGCLLAALLSERDILVNAEHSDITERVLIFNDYIKSSSSHKAKQSINRNVLVQASKLANSFASLLGGVNLAETLSLTDVHEYIGPLLLTAYPDRLAQQRGNGSERYLLANGRGVALKAGDGLAGEPWLVVCDCDGKNKDGAIYSAAAISLSAIKTSLQADLDEQTHYALDTNKEKVIGRRKVNYRSLVIDEVSLSKIPPAEFQLCVQDILRQEGLTFLNWTAKCEAWLARVNWLGQQVENFPLLSEKSLLNDLATWLLPYLTNINTIKQLRQLNIYDLLMANLSWQQQQFLTQHAPEQYITPSNKSVLIRYDQHQGPTVSVILQEMFGQLTSPLLAQGKVPLRFELLSPARRPIQTTSDLANFWRSSYFEVAKDMRGKYPKHRWPEKPLEEAPGRSIAQRRK